MRAGRMLRTVQVVRPRRQPEPEVDSWATSPAALLAVLVPSFRTVRVLRSWAWRYRR